MTDLLKQEFYKFMHQKSILFSPAILLALMVFMAFSVLVSSGKNYMIVMAFNGAEWLDFLLIIAGANLISMEFQYGTIKHMMAQHNQRLLIYLSKMMVLAVYSFVLHLLTFGFTVTLKYLFFGKAHSFNTIYYEHQTILQNLITGLSSNLFSTLLLMTIIFLIASVSRTGTVAAVIGILYLFMATSLASLINQMVGKWFPLIKWNPMNMFYVAFQFMSPSIQHESLLTNAQLIWGNLIWAGLFIVIGYYAFKRKRI